MTRYPRESPETTAFFDAIPTMTNADDLLGELDKNFGSMTEFRLGTDMHETLWRAFWKSPHDPHLDFTDAGTVVVMFRGDVGDRPVGRAVVFEGSDIIDHPDYRLPE